MEQDYQREQTGQTSVSPDDTLEGESKQIRWTAIRRLFGTGIASFIGLFSFMAFDSPSSSEKLWPYFFVAVMFGLPAIGCIVNFSALVFSFSDSLHRARILIQFSKWIWYGIVSLFIAGIIASVLLIVMSLSSISR